MPRSVSIVIPARNEEKYIGECLASIDANVSDQVKLEVFVCDGRSTDRTKEIVMEYAQRHTYVQLLDNPDNITSFGLNLGIRRSAGEVIVILGAHAEIAPDYIAGCLRTLDLHPDAGCVGGVLDSVPNDDRSEAISNAMSSPFGVGNAYFRTGAREGYVDTVAFAAYRREVFDRIGYFDEELVRNQDDELNFRLLKHGYRIFLDKSIKARYYVRASYRKLFSQYLQYGYWKVRVNRKHRMITTVRQMIPFFFVCYLVAGAIASLFSERLFYISTGILFLYIILGLYFSLKFTKKPRQVIRTMYAFFTLHISYGAGYLGGIMEIIVPLMKKKHAR